jgi:hypothetical protein
MVETSDRIQAPKPTDFSSEQLHALASGKQSLEQFRGMLSEQAKAYQGLAEKQGFPSTGTLLPDGSSADVKVYKGGDGQTERVRTDPLRLPIKPGCVEDLRGFHDYDLTGKNPSYSFDRNGNGAIFLPAGKDQGRLGIFTHDASGQEHDTLIDYENGNVKGAPRDVDLSGDCSR